MKKFKKGHLGEDEFMQIANLISQGFTEGTLDSKDTHLTWKLNASVSHNYDFDDLPDNGVGG